MTNLKLPRRRLVEDVIGHQDSGLGVGEAADGLKRCGPIFRFDRRVVDLADDLGEFTHNRDVRRQSGLPLSENRRAGALAPVAPFHA